MAPRLEDHQHELIVQYIAEGRSNKDIAELVNCNSRSVTAIRGKLRKWGATTQPNPKPPGRPGHISDDMRDVLLRRLKEKPTMYQDEMASFLQDVFKTEVSYYMVGRLLKTINWSRKEVSRRYHSRATQEQVKCKWS